MMPIGNISSRNFWRVRGQKTTAQVINSGGEATTTTGGTKPRTEAGRVANQPAGSSFGGAAAATSAEDSTASKQQQLQWQREEERFFAMLFFLGMGACVLAVAASVTASVVRGHGSGKRTEEYVVGGWRTEATIKLGDSIWDTIKKASP